MKKIFAATAAVVLVAGCAQQPAAISPVAMGDVYSNVSCSKAKQLYSNEAAKVPSLVASQKQAVTGDAIGVFLLAVPVSSLSGGDKEGEISTSKGKINALGARLETCGLTPTPVVWG